MNSKVEQHPAYPCHLQNWLSQHPPLLDTSGKQAVTDTTAESELDRYRIAIRKYDPRRQGLPWSMRCQCPNCGQVVPGQFRKVGKQVVLVIDCPSDGQIRQVHYDTIYSDGPAELRTFSGAPIQPHMKGLPRTVETLCPECSCVILGRYYVRDAAVWIEKTCPQHGYFRDCVNRDVRIFVNAGQWQFEEPAGLLHPHVVGGQRCPSDCGLCDAHQSSACLANIDLTNRCNLNCPVCFANSNVSGYLYEPSFDQVVQMLQRLRDYRPTPCTCIQFSGGEPTLHPQFLRIVSKAADMGFSNIQIATNGIKMADPDFARQAADAGLHTLYLQFDGVDDEVYLKTRNRPLMAVKRKCVENCRRFGMKICLVPTVIRTQSDDQVGKILQFAVDNVDVVSGISYQPVSFTGRIDYGELEKKRYTLGDLVHDIAKASGADPYHDFFPLSFAVPFSELLSIITGQPKITSSCHTACAIGTYLFVSPDKKLYPFPQVFDISRLFTELHQLCMKVRRKGRVGTLDKLRALWLFYKHFRRDRAPADLGFYRMLRSLRGMVNKRIGRGAGEEKNYRTLMAAGMHFQDRYNFDVQRIKRCVIQYSTPEGVFPFCTYNCGPTFRPFVEKMHAKQGAAAERAGQPDSPSGLDSDSKITPAQPMSTSAETAIHP